MERLIIIPARAQSQRFPNKPLASLVAHDGTRRTLVEWVWHAGVAALGAGHVIVATDSMEIADHVRSFGGRAELTSSAARNGTERCAMLLRQLDIRPDIVINLQGDSPLVPPAYVAALCERFADASVQFATPYVTCDAAMQATLLDHAGRGLVGGTCVVTRSDGQAAYFSKRPIPHGAHDGLPLKLHIGLYAYRPAVLEAYCDLPPSPLELAEGLEQLRLLEAGWPIHMVEVELPGGGLWEVNNPEDVPLVEAALPTA